MTNGHDDAPPEEEVPPGRTIDIEGYVPPPLGAIQSRPPTRIRLPRASRDMVLAVRASARRAEDAIFYGAAIHDLGRLIGNLGGRQGAVGIPEVTIGNSFTLLFTTSGEAEQTLQGPTSEETKAAQLLRRALASDSADELLTIVRPGGESVRTLEHFLRVLFDHQATVDFEVPHVEPVRVTPDRAAALFHALREPYTLPPVNVTVHAHLVGAIFDTQDFKLRLADAWDGKSVFHGKYVDDLADEMERFVNRDVVADVRIEREHRGAHAATATYTLLQLREPPPPLS